MWGGGGEGENAEINHTPRKKRMEEKVESKRKCTRIPGTADNELNLLSKARIKSLEGVKGLKDHFASRRMELHPGVFQSAGQGIEDRV